MLQIAIPLTSEGWDEEKQEFVEPKTQILCLEHSLVSLRKWESRWCKPFLSNKSLTVEETIDYIKCMTLTQNVPSEVYNRITDKNIEEVSAYIDAPMTATWFTEEKGGKPNTEVVTAELIYYWMIALNIPFECQKWHLNSLLTLVKVCNIKNTPPKKMGKNALLNRHASVNAARRQKAKAGR